MNDGQTLEELRDVLDQARRAGTLPAELRDLVFQQVRVPSTLDTPADVFELGATFMDGAQPVWTKRIAERTWAVAWSGAQLAAASVDLDRRPGPSEVERSSLLALALRDWTEGRRMPLTDAEQRAEDKRARRRARNLRNRRRRAAERDTEK